MRNTVETPDSKAYGKWQSGQFTGTNSHRLPMITMNGYVLTPFQDGNSSGLLLLNQEGQEISRHLEPLPPSAVLADSRRQLIYTCTDKTGALTAYTLSATGQLMVTDRIDLGQASQPQAISLAPDRLLVVCDFKQDRLLTYTISDHHFRQVSQIDLLRGTGPAQLLFNPQHKAVYVLGQASQTVETFFYDGCGAFEHYQSHALPQAVTDYNQAIGMCLSADSRCLTVTHQGPEPLTGFLIQADGNLVAPD